MVNTHAELQKNSHQIVCILVKAKEKEKKQKRNVSFQTCYIQDCQFF